jgi:hypothetical protein
MSATGPNLFPGSIIVNDASGSFRVGRSLGLISSGTTDNGYEPLICANDAAAIEEAKRFQVRLVSSFAAVSDWSRD